MFDYRLRTLISFSRLSSLPLRAFLSIILIAYMLPPSWRKLRKTSFIILSSHLYTGCSLNIVFFPKILKYSGLWPFSVFPRCQCVYTYQAGRTQALQQNWQSSEKSQNFKEKTQYLNNTLYILYVNLYPFNLFIRTPIDLSLRVRYGYYGCY